MEDWWFYGEGPTEVIEGTFAENKRKDFSAQVIRFTQSKDGRKVYAILMGWPGDGAVVSIRSMSEGRGPVGIRSVNLLGKRGKLKFDRAADGLKVTLPDKALCDHAVVLRIVPRA